MDVINMIDVADVADVADMIGAWDTLGRFVTGGPAVRMQDHG